MPDTVSPENDLSECIVQCLESTEAMNRDIPQNGEIMEYAQELLKIYQEGGFRSLEQKIGREHAEKLSAIIFAKERSIRIKKQCPPVSPATSEDPEIVTAESLFGELPPTLVDKPKESLKRAGLCSFIYRMEHANTENKVETIETKFGELLEALQASRVVLLQGDTGCGKTTKIPRMLLKHYNHIVCTQPRRLAAVNVARKVAADLSERVGETVGYSVRFEERRTKKTRLHFLTDGMLIKEISGHLSSKHNALFSKYDLIIIDEAHERSINIDFLMGFIKSQPSNKLLVMSATLDTECFLNYFNAPLVEIKHRKHPIEHFYLKEQVEDYFNAAIETVTRIVDEYDEGDILVFLTGQEEIEQGYDILMGEIGKQIRICKLYAAMPPEEQDKAFRAGERKIVLSTNIAETSVTIENILFVVDSGRVKQMRRGSGCSIDFMEIVWISKSQAKQRAGRAGRTRPGKVFRLYTRWEYENMQDRATPEILRSSLNSVILSLKSMHVNDVVNFEYLDRPSLESISDSLRSLYYMRAVDGNGLITRLGFELASSSFEPQMALVLKVARENGSLNAVATIAAFLNVGHIFIEPRRRDEAYKALRKRQLHKNGDFYTFLQIYEEWRKDGFSNGFLAKNLLRKNALETVLQIKMQILEGGSKRPYFLVKKAALMLPHIRMDAALEYNLMEAFCSGYFMNVAKIAEKAYITIFGHTLCYLHPNDPLMKKYPKYVLFHELVCTRKEFMRGCLEVTANVLHRACNRPFKK